MVNVGTLKQLTKPRPLSLGVAGKVEHDGYTSREQRAYVPRKSVPQPGRVLDEARNVYDLSGGTA
jgi:hypothetical protein